MSMKSTVARFLQRAADSLDDGSVPDGIKPPSRQSADSDPLTLSTVFRAIQILQTAVSGLPIYEYRNNVRLASTSLLIENPDVNRSRRDWIADIVASLAIDGNAFVRLNTFDGTVISAEVLNPQLVAVSQVNTDPASPILHYQYLGKTYPSGDIVHLKFLNVPGALRGMGPISAARIELESAMKARDLKAQYYTDGSNAKGYLRSTQPVSPAVAKQAAEAWKQGEAGGVRVLGNGFEYSQLTLKPEDLQYLGTMKFDATQIARLMGVPASLMLAAVDGSNLTYSNIEQSWIEFADYTLAAYTGEIEEVFNRILPRGRAARFDWDSARHSNTSERYNSYKTALDAGWLTINEIRTREGLPALEEGQSHE